MAGILGFTFHLGPEVPRPPRADPSRNWDDCISERRTWVDAMRDAVREHDAWGLLCTAPDAELDCCTICDSGYADLCSPVEA